MTQLSFLDNKPTEMVSWIGARGPALERLNTFLPRAGRAYASSRNHDFGPENRSNISCLSPWIRHRLLLETEVVKETLARHSFASAEKFLQEVFWRAYFKGWLEQRPDVWSHYRADLRKLIKELDHSSTLHDGYETAINGATGIDCFDEWVRELTETGYLHNHARMWFASIWIFTLRLPWQLGADFFYRHLLDGDPASNTLSWRWVAGLHTKGKTYLARVSNIEKYTEGRFSPKGLADNAPPLREDFEYQQQPLSASSPFVAEEPFCLLITQDDCNVESLPLTGMPEAITGLLASESDATFKTASFTQKFTVDALNDALDRAGAHFECDAHLDNAEDWGQFLVQWAKELEIKTIVTAWVPVGPVRDKLDMAQPSLMKAGIRLVQVRRRYDEICWPHTTRGFFKLKTKIPNLIRDLNLNPI